MICFGSKGRQLFFFIDKFDPMKIKLVLDPMGLKLWEDFTGKAWEIIAEGNCLDHCICRDLTFLKSFNLEKIKLVLYEF